MDIIIAINSNYLEMCKTMIFSLLRNNSKSNIVIHVLNKNLSAFQIKSLREFVESHGGKCVIYQINDSIFEHLTLGLNRFSIEMYYRILAFEIIPANINRAMWLDSDLLILDDISDFYFQNFEGKELIACQDAYCNSEFINNIKKKLDLDDEHVYFNSGVLIFNFELIRKTFNNKRLYEVLNLYQSNLTYPDQDLLNKIYTHKVKYCSWYKFNFQVNETYNSNLKNVKILHYAGARKPWLASKAYPICKSYWKERLLMRDYKGFIKFYLLYFLLFIPKTIKRNIRIKHEDWNT